MSLNFRELGNLSKCAIGAMALSALVMTSATAHASAGCVGDLNGDGVIDGADLGLLLNQWNTGGSADLNGDGVVDGADLGLMLNGWGDCSKDLVIHSVEPAFGGPGDFIQIIGQFPTDDPYDACLQIRANDPDAENGVVMPIEAIELINDGGQQRLLARLGPKPEGIDGEAMLMVMWGDGYPTTIPNPFEPLIIVTDEGACWGDGQGEGQNIIFNVGGGPGQPLGPGTACGPGWTNSHVGFINGGDLCVDIGGGTGPNRTYPAGTEIEIWPRFHTCDGLYTKDFGTIRLTTTVSLSPLTVAGFLAALIEQEINACGPMSGLTPVVTTTPLGGNNFRICISLPGHPVCWGNLVICVK